MKINKLSELPAGIDVLLNASISEGFGMVKKLVDKYQTGENDFSARGEALFGAFNSGQLVGIGGLNIDPYFKDESLGRVRHLYVLPSARNLGVGRAIVFNIEQQAKKYFSCLQLQSPNQQASAFYRRLGYTEVNDIAKVSHVKYLGSSDTVIV